MRAVQDWVCIIRPCILLLALFCALAQTLHQHFQPRLHKRSNAPQQQQPNVQQQFPAFHQGGGGPFPAQALASKLAGPPLVEGGPPPPRAASNAIIHPNAGQQQAQPPPQFVANNGPLIRSPDGQFVLAPQPSQHQQPQFGGAFFQQGSSPPLGFQPQFGQASSAQFAPPPSSSQPQGSQFAPPTNNNNNNNNGGAFPPFSSQPNAPPPAVPNNSASSPLPNGGPAEFTNSSDSSTPATGPTSPLPPVDKSVDLDGDGALSLNEVQYAAFVHHGLSSSVVENLFNEVDHNKDAFLSALEFNDIRPLVLAKAENAALRYLQNVDTDHNGLLSLQEAQAYILREYGISNRDVERIWRLVVPSSSDEMDAVLFSKLRRRVRGMSIRLARQIMKGSDRDQDGHIDLREAQLIAFEQEGIGPAEVIEMLASVDDNNDGQLNAPEFADFERIVRAKSVETSKKALKVVDTDGSGSLTMEEAKKIAFDHYGFDEATLEPFFAQADENEDGQLDSVEFAGFRSVIRGRAVKNALMLLPEMDDDGDGLISEAEAEQRTRREDDMTPSETHGLFSVADQDRNGLLDKVELADFVRLVRLTSIKFVADHFRDYDSNRDKLVTLDELEKLVKDRYKLDPGVTRRFFDKVDVDRSGDLNPGEIVDFRHEVRRLAQDRVMQAELEEQNRREMAEIEQRLRHEAEARKPQPESAQKTRQESSSAEDNSARSSTEGPRKAPIETTSPAGKESVEEVEEQQQRHREEENSGRVVEDAEEKEKEPRSGTGGDKRPTTRGESAVDEEHPGPTTTSSSGAAASSAASSSAIHGSTTTTNENDPEPQPSPNKSIASSDGGENNSPAISPMASATNSLPTTAANGTEGAKVMAASDSIGTTTKKQRKRRRKTTTPASTSTTTTSTTTTTTTTTTTPTSTTTTTAQPAAEESYEESAEEEPATGGEN